MAGRAPETAVLSSQELAASIFTGPDGSAFPYCRDAALSTTLLVMMPFDLLSLAFFVDWVEDASSTASRPGLMFRPPKHPGVLIEPARQAPLESSVAFDRGKSCLLTWTEPTDSLSLELYLVDVLDTSIEPRGVLLGAGRLRMRGRRGRRRLRGLGLRAGRLPRGRARLHYENVSRLNW